jgi:ribosomal protein L11 methyltransferase
VHLSEQVWTTHLPGDADLPDDPDAVAARIAEISGLDDVHVELAWQEQEEWEEVWKAGLEARRVTDRLVVTPSWIQPTRREGDIVLVLDPGMAFGNAEHGTTRGCLRLLDGVLREGDRVLDVGAGSAVLSIASVLLGAGSALAIEGDELAVPTARENAERNGVGDRVEVVHARVDAADLARIGGEGGGFDGVMCNIEGHLLAPLLPGLIAAVRPGGWLLLSGILDDQWSWFEAEVTGRGPTLEATDADGEWRSGRFCAGSAPAGGAGPAPGTPPAPRS